MGPVLINAGLYDYRLVWVVRDGRVITPEKKTVLFSADSERRERKKSVKEEII
jgi:hypothetical protein